MTHEEDHSWAKDRIAAYLSGELTAEDRDRLDAHLDACGACAQEVQETAIEEVIEPEPPPTIRERFLRSLQASPAARALLAGAAVVLLGIIGLLIVETEPGGLLASERLVALDAAEVRIAASRSADETPSADSGPQGRRPGTSHIERPRDVFSRMGLLKEDLSPQPSSDPAVFFPEAKESADHNEADSRQRKGDSKDFLSFIKGEPQGGRRNMIRPAERALATESAPEGLARGGGSSYGGRATGKVFVPGKDEGAEPEIAEEQRIVAVRDAIRNQEEAVRAQRKIVRSGEMEFEIESFDTAVAIVMKITLEEKGFIATINSEKLQNGKVRGTVVVRVPPDHLDTLLLKLRALGDLRSQKIGSEDVTKHYTDLESRLRAARTMEERLINIIKDGKGLIKDLLQAERELGEWRTKIESMVGEINYYNNLIAHSTLMISLTEKEIRAPFAVVETERVTMGVEVDDVDKAHRETLAAVAEANGRVTRSDLRQSTNDQYQSFIQFEVAPDRAIAIRDRIKQMGILSGLEITRVQEKQGGSGKPQEAKVRQGDTQVTLSLTNASELFPRETVYLNLASADAEKSYREIVARVEKATGRFTSSQLTRQKNDQTSGALVFQVRTAEADGVLADLRAAGEVLKLDVRETIGNANTTRAKRGFVVSVSGYGSLQPRETSTVVIASRNVASGYAALVEAIKAAEGRIVNAELNESDRKKMTASLSVDLRREHEKAIAEAIAKVGDVYTRTSTRAQDGDQVIDSKIALHLRFFDAANIPARETVKMSLEVGDVEAAAKALESQFQGRVVDARHTRQASGERESLLTVDVPMKELAAAVDRIKSMGVLGEHVATRQAAVPDNDLAVARLDVRVANRVLVSDTSGPGANIRKGLAFSLQAASWSLMLIMVGVCFVLPLATMIWLSVLIRRKLRAKPAPAA